LKKFDYTAEKIEELTSWLDNGYEYKKLADCIEVKANGFDKKRITHFISTLNGIIKVPPLTMQYCEAEQLVTIFDQR